MQNESPFKWRHDGSLAKAPFPRDLGIMSLGIKFRSIFCMFSLGWSHPLMFTITTTKKHCKMTETDHTDTENLIMAFLGGVSEYLIFFYHLPQFLNAF
jgi:hypothetical protein